MAKRLEVLNMDLTYMQESLAFGYLVGDFEVSWKNLVWPLSSTVWVQLGIIGLLFSGLLFAAHHFRRRGIIRDNLSFLDGFAIFLGIAVALPRNSFGRYVFGMWIFHSYLTVTAYNSGLVSFLTTPYEKRILRTFKDLLDGGLEFGGGTFHREFYNDPSDPDMKRIYDRFKVFPINQALRLPTIHKIATGVLTSTVRVYNTDHRDNASNQLRMLEETAFTFHVPIYMRRGSPLTHGIHRYASHAIQSGFVDYWMRHYYRPASTFTTKTPSVLTVNHIRGILVLHSAGLVFSSIVFLGEIIYHKRSVGQH
ncbi:uncharacterized protein LOC125500701 [Athalia rosae]|uniref:uncharacterized protein LOC125500701 n=1 Tax=Athalia rosae TaxID=37344 RepID=UPI0020335A70|nr:uncharacterized protein LOC125500701 [Athalia rosae]